MKPFHVLHPRIEALEARIAPATIYGIDDSNNLISFDSATPGTATIQPITGLAVPATEKIKGIDFRPATGELYALGINDFDANDDEARLYTIDVATGVATLVGPGPFLTDLTQGNDYAFDFNPVADRIRIITDRNDNIRVNPNSGALVQNDTDITGGNLNVVGVAYDRNFDATSQTTLYGIDHDNVGANDSLVLIGGPNGTPSPNGGVTSLVGLLGVNVDSYRIGFDIESRTGTAYASLRVGGVTGLYTIDLATGAATSVGTIASSPLLHSIAVALPNDLTIVNATTATYIDQDGDKVTVRLTKGTLADANFTFSTGRLGSQLRLLDIADDNHGQLFAGSNITITATPSGTLGDGFANIGYIRANGVDLGRITIDGDLAQIDAGNATTSTPGIAALTAQSMGVLGGATQLPSNSSDLTSEILGRLGALTIKTNLNGATINVTGGADGSIGNIKVGGNIVGTTTGGIYSTGNMGNVTLLGSLFGGYAANVGNIDSEGTMGKVTVGGSIYGGFNSNTGIIESTGNMGAVSIKGDVVGGTRDHTGNIHSNASIASVTVKGSILGNEVLDPVMDFDSGIIYAFGPGVNNIGPVKIGGILQGANGNYSGSVFAADKITSVTVGGSLIGAGGSSSGSIETGSGLGKVKVGVDLRGGTGNWSGSVRTFFDGDIAGVTVGGSVSGFVNSLTGILSDRMLGPVKIGGDLRGTLSGGVRISAEGQLDVVGGIKSIAIKGDMLNALILSGYSEEGLPGNPDASIGAITIGGNLVASTIVAGVATGLDGVFGTLDDALIPEGVADSIVAKIASISVKGYVAGTAVPGDRYGIVAEHIVKLVVDGAFLPLLPNANNDTFGVHLELGTRDDFRAFEVPV